MILSKLCELAAGSQSVFDIAFVRPRIVLLVKYFVSRYASRNVSESVTNEHNFILRLLFVCWIIIIERKAFTIGIIVVYNERRYNEQSKIK